MLFSETPLQGAVIIESPPAVDDRGTFSRLFCAEEFQAHSLPPTFVQSGLVHNKARGTLRGMHFQRAPKAEGKLVRCIRGGIYDVIVDLRPSSPTLRRWFALELTGAGTRALYVPPGFAHGYLTLTDEAEILYQMTESYAAELADGVRWNDPAFGISWPDEVRVISERDRNFRDYQADASGCRAD
jgi:dTDP-4-dehydrorhamnose 3,5-epimerase